MSDEFKSTYGQLMSLTAIGGGLSRRQEQALRDLDGLMVVAEYALQEAPVGAGTHSTICALMMDAYAKGRASCPDGGERLRSAGGEGHPERHGEQGQDDDEMHDENPT